MVPEVRIPGLKWYLKFEYLESGNQTVITVLKLLLAVASATLFVTYGQRELCVKMPSFDIT